MEEAQAGGLIDKYWIFNWIIMPLVFIALIIGVLWHSCPYVEDVSSCFPYNLPNWVKIGVPILIIIILPILLVIISKLHKQGYPRQ